MAHDNDLHDAVNSKMRHATKYFGSISTVVSLPLISGDRSNIYLKFLLNNDVLQIFTLSIHLFCNCIFLMFFDILILILIY